MASTTSPKAMKLLGLSKLPPGASPVEHAALIRQHRSVRLECAKSMPGSGHERVNSPSGMRSGSSSPIRYALGDLEEVQDLPFQGRSGSGEDHSGHGTISVGGGEQAPEENDILMDVREASLKLNAADLDDDYIRAIADLMVQFPEPPARSPVNDFGSPFSSTSGRGKIADERGLYGGKSMSNRRPGEQEQQQIERCHSPVQQFNHLQQHAVNHGYAVERPDAHETEATNIDD